MPANEDQVVMFPVRRNPSWSREELILALELYFRVPPSGVTETHPEIIRVSEELQRLSAYADPADATRFRNPNGVHMKMFNFMALDPSQGGRGLANGGRKDREVWNEYHDDRGRLSQVASAIRSAIDTKGALRELLKPQKVKMKTPRKGACLHGCTAIVSAIQRLCGEKKLSCKRRELYDVKPVTSISPNFYGELGEGFIECHHTKPIALLNPGDRTKMSELALVCANCHRILHRPKRWLEVAGLRAILVSSNRKAAERRLYGA